MSIHKLTAGSGYDYLTRQVAAQDATEKGHTGLASYYTERGETPGQWVGSGMAGIDGLAAGDVVTAEQMQALFGSGHHPLAQQRRGQLQGPGLTERAYQGVTRLGVPYKVFSGDVSAFRLEVAKRIADINQVAGLPGDWPVPADQRAQVRTAVAREFFVAEHGRQPEDARELAGLIARHSRPKTQAVAGYDLTFSPVKSVSTLWAVADPQVAARIELAHQGAVKDALAFIENHALFTREGANGVRQVDVAGIVATAFTHRDSRAGDPDLHTHVAVANKVATKDGRWLSIDGRVLFKATVAASETYNTSLERHLRDGLGLRFEERANPDVRKRPVREVVGVDPGLNQRWSARRASIQARHGELATDFQATHGRPPTPVESLHLAQQATLQTREAKHQPRTLAEQRATWRAQAVEVLGAPEEVATMISGALSPEVAPGPVVDSAWVAGASARVLEAMEARRSTWQTWHVRAEVLRQVRGAEVPTGQVDRVVDLLVGEVLDSRSVSLARPEPGIIEPHQLRRADGSSVYTVAGAQLFTSARVLAAEQRLVAIAGRRDGHAVEDSSVHMALLESAANGVTLNAGQAALVRTMATSGGRLQLAIAPAGAGKTTAMRALAGAWTEGGGTVVGLAPSAAAAAALRTQIGASTDTLAKLTWSLEHRDLPGWAQQIGPSTLVVIDEAGMADTLSLDAAVNFIVGRGGSVRLIGDDQQLAAIGAGGVLRDIAATHGATRLGELLRFADPAESAASLALREGHTEALGFYLDSGRVHVGDLATMTEDVFTSWQADRGRGLDSIMLAPTRELVSELNQRARAHRLSEEQGPEGTPAGPVLRLADGNEANIGELIITRSNDRTLRTSATDWVKNGDRWMVLGIHDAGDLTVQHTQSGRRVRLPAGYVQAATELGYATTVHTAQGVSVDTMHALASGQETRQQLYTMMTRGALGNHVYLQVVGDGDPHSVIRPELVRPLTPTDLLEGMLARDHAPRSATTLVRDLSDPANCLGEATARYVDALYVAAESVVGRDVVQSLDASADRAVAGLVDEAAWPALRAHLLLLGASGANPVEHLRAAAAERELDTAGDKAAVLDWRLDETGLRNAGSGPLPWIPGIPAVLRAHDRWGDYLTQRAERVADLAQQVRAAAEAGSGQSPAWAHQGAGRLPAGVLGDAAVWRSAMQVDPVDRRPTGAPQMQKAAATWQRNLHRRLAGEGTPPLQEWGELIQRAAPGAASDDFTPLLGKRLASISRAGVDARGLLAAAVAAGTLPDDHAAAALWWRISRHLSPAVAEQIDADDALTTSWTPRLTELVGSERAEAVQSSPWWPTLVTTVDHGIARGWRLQDLLGSGAGRPAGDVDDQCLAMVWRMSVLMDPVPDEERYDPPQQEPPEDMWDSVMPPEDAADFARWDEPVGHARTQHPVEVVDESPAPDVDPDVDPADDELVGAESDLTMAATLRDVLGPPEQTDADVDRMLARAAEWDYCPVSRQRMLQINDLSLRFFQDQFPHSSGRPYLARRFGTDPLEHPHFRPGQAPAGWTHLVNHLRSRGVTEQEMLATGVATTASTGRLIDRFRDRVVFPIAHKGEVLGFVGRRHPDLTDADKGVPKYLNTADTPLFHKGAQLFGAVEAHLAAGAIPVIVEGPMDAIAVTIATAGSHVGLAPLGTSLTQEQAARLGRLGVDPIVATDADLAGQVAAERDFWMLTPHGLDPGYAQFPEGLDPADMLELRGPSALRDALAKARPLADVLVEERLANLPAAQARAQAAQVVAARPSSRWAVSTERISGRLRVSMAVVHRDLHPAVAEWNRDPRKAAQKPLQNITEVRRRLTAAANRTLQERWAPLAAELDPRLVREGDWPALASLMQDAHAQGHDVVAATRALVGKSPLGELPAQDLRYRLVARFDVDVDVDTDEPQPETRPASSVGTARERKEPTAFPSRPTGRRR